MLQQRISRSSGNPLLHLAILDFAVPVFTTNYDNVIEGLIADYKVEGYKRTALTYEDEKDAALLLSPSRQHENYIFKIHGSIDRTHPLILDERDYSDFYFRAKWPTSLQLLRHIMATKMAIFVGFSLSDPEIMLILREAVRHAASYQHLALLHASQLSPIEVGVLRSTYRVDPVLYEEHTHLPLFVMEMRNFYHRELLSLHIIPEKDKLVQALSIMKTQDKLLAGASAILFGSYAKYGSLSQQADVDVLFLTDWFVSKAKVQSAAADEVLGRPIDATVMQWSEFERLLRCGDPFASSVLVTGCPVEDVDGRYGVLSRGFAANYHYEAVLKNALDRYQMRWVRLCVYRNANLKEYVQACHQWSIALMQLLVVRNYYPLDSLLSVSLLGNARFTIREFATRFESVDESYFTSLMYLSKGVVPLTNAKPPDMHELIQVFTNILQQRYDSNDLELLLPGTFVKQADSQMVAQAYKKLAVPLRALAHGEAEIFFGYGTRSTEKSFLEAFSELREATRGQITTYDCLFFVELHEWVMKEYHLDTPQDEDIIRGIEVTRRGWCSEKTEE